MAVFFAFERRGQPMLTGISNKKAKMPKKASPRPILHEAHQDLYSQVRFNWSKPVSWLSRSWSYPQSAALPYRHGIMWQWPAFANGRRYAPTVAVPCG